MASDRITAALAKLDHGSWSLTVGGFGCKAMGFKPPYTAEQRRHARDAMMATDGLAYRRITLGVPIEVWDWDAR